MTGRRNHAGTACSLASSPAPASTEGRLSAIGASPMTASGAAGSRQVGAARVGLSTETISVIVNIACLNMPALYSQTQLFVVEIPSRGYTF